MPAPDPHPDHDDATNSGQSADAPAEGADDTPDPDEGSPKA